MRNVIIVLLSLYSGIALDAIHLSDREIELLGRSIWKSECNCSDNGLLTWNKGEPFPSLGIGHFIWYPTECTQRTFEQTFPQLITFMTQHKVNVPQWLVDQCTIGCPWATKESFMAALQSSQMQSLKRLLQDTISLQARFIVYRFEKELEIIMQSLPRSERTMLQQRIDKLSRSYQGMFALIDYTHFKGSGANAQESYQGHSWGLLSVLRLMNDISTDSLHEFVRTAKQLLSMRVEHAPNKEQEQRWLKGWHARIDRYLQT